MSYKNHVDSVLTMKRCVTQQDTSTMIVASSITDTIHPIQSTRDDITSSTDTVIIDTIQMIPLSTSVQTSIGMVSPAVFPTTACDSEGFLQCHGLEGFSQCVYGYTVFKSCPPGTVCKENSGMKPASIFCDFP